MHMCVLHQVAPRKVSLVGTRDVARDEAAANLQGQVRVWSAHLCILATCIFITCIFATCTLLALVSDFMLQVNEGKLAAGTRFRWDKQSSSVRFPRCEHKMARSDSTPTDDGSQATACSR